MLIKMMKPINLSLQSDSTKTPTTNSSNPQRQQKHIFFLYVLYKQQHDGTLIL